MLNTHVFNSLSRWRERVGVRVALLASLFLSTPLHAAQLHALVIGIDQYLAQGGQLKDLQGAVNDARDIAAALQEHGVDSLTVLLDREANRDAIFKALADMKQRARPGDTLLITYAGHGSQEPEHTPGQEADGQDEVIVLGGFRNTAPQNYQRILDDEIRAWVAGAADYRVILLFDACNSGTLNRSLALDGLNLPTRFDDYDPIPPSEETLPPLPATELPAGTLAHEIYLAASEDGQATVEMLIDGQARGALSYLFARAVRGDGDDNSDGMLSRGELRRYLQAGVRQRTESRQEASVLFAGADTEPVLPVRGATPPAAVPAPVITPTPTIVSTPLADNRLALAVINYNGSAQALLQKLPQVQLAATPDKAELIWDVANGRLISALNDVVAHVAADQSAAVQGVIEKWQALPAFKALAERRPLPISLSGGGKLYREKETVTITVEPHSQPYLTLINLASTGEVQFLYPLSEYNDDPRFDPAKKFELPVEVKKPFGADHLLALASSHQPVELQKALAKLNGQMAAAALLKALEQALQQPGTAHELGILGFYTAP